MGEVAVKQAVQAPVPQAPVNNGPVLQRKCKCGSYGGGECDKCRNRGGIKLQRTACTADEPAGLPQIVHDVLGSSGQPLHLATRSWMEPRFGHDFSRVRVHTDARAAESAQAVNARAYTVGRNVVFGPGQYAPGTAHGSRLLAHELTHVVQQDRAGGSTSQFSRAISHPSDSAELEADAASARIMAGDAVAVRQPPSAALHGQNIGEAIGIGLGAAAGGALLGLGIYGLVSLLTRLSPEEKQAMITAAKDGAVTWLTAALRKINAFLVNPGATTPDEVAARTALQRHFHATDATTATAVRDRLNQINAIFTNWATMSLQIHDDTDLQCKSAGAYVPGGSTNQVIFCPKFFEGSAVWRVEALIHELAHTLTGGAHITDRGYQSDRVYPILSTAEALTNAESFGLLIQDLGASERSTFGGPGDVGQDCPTDWKELLDVAIARGQRWNRNAQVAVADRDPAWIAGLTPLLTRQLGGATPAILDAASTVYTKAADKLDSSVQFECELEGGGRCDTSVTYWYAILSDFHICPSWKNIANEDDRIEQLLRGFYGYAAGVDDDTQRQKYAKVARCITNTNAEWRTPGSPPDPTC